MSGMLSALQGAAAQGMLFALMALGVYITYRILDYPDLTVDGSFALGGAVCAVTMVAGVHPILALLIAMVAGMLAGAMTGFLHTMLKIPKILSGILMMTALYSINLRVMGGPNVSMLKIERLHDKVINLLGGLINFKDSHRYLIWIVLGAIVLAIVIAALYWFFGTELGSALRATGDNEAMIRALGGNTNVSKVLALMISNGFVAMSGALITQYQGSATVTMGTGTIAIGLASVIIGEVIFCRKERPFAFKLIAIALGAVIYRVAIAAVLQLGLNPDDMKLLTALIVAIALSVPVIKDKISKMHKKRENQKNMREVV